MLLSERGGRVGGCGWRERQVLRMPERVGIGSFHCEEIRYADRAASTVSSVAHQFNAHDGGAFQSAT